MSIIYICGIFVNDISQWLKFIPEIRSGHQKFYPEKKVFMVLPLQNSDLIITLFYSTIPPDHDVQSFHHVPHQVPPVNHDTSAPCTSIFFCYNHLPMVLVVCLLSGRTELRETPNTEFPKVLVGLTLRMQCLFSLQ